MVKRNAPRPTCHICSSVPELAHNHRGGRFWVCKRCNITWNLRDGKVNGCPSVVAGASRNRSRCTSLREQVIAQLEARGENAKEWLDNLPLLEIQELLRVA